MFKSRPVPCVGVSVGVERVFTIMEAKARRAASEGGGQGLRRTPVQCMVASIPSTRGKYDMAVERMRAVGELWAAGVSAETLFPVGDPKLQKQLAEALEKGVSLLVVLAEDELDRGEVVVKMLASRTERVFRRDALVREVRALVAGAEDARGGAGRGPEEKCGGESIARYEGVISHCSSSFPLAEVDEGRCALRSLFSRM